MTFFVAAQSVVLGTAMQQGGLAQENDLEQERSIAKRHGSTASNSVLSGEKPQSRLAP
jgi:hypothetical protein